MRRWCRCRRCILRLWKDSPVKVPITEAQREIYFAAALGDEVNCAFNESVTLRLRGDVDERALKHALESVFARHHALRSTISEDGRIDIDHSHF